MLLTTYRLTYHLATCNIDPNNAPIMPNLANVTVSLKFNNSFLV